MEPKKNPKKDLNRNQGVYFVLGLLLSLLLTFTALEWKTFETTYDPNIALNQIDETIDEEPPIFQLQTPPPTPPPVVPTEIEIVEDEDPIVETIIESTETNQEDNILEVNDIEVDEIDEPEEISFMLIEDVPVFPGCEDEKDKRACFQKMMNKHIVKNFHYPEVAQEMGIQGRVNIMFVIQKDGSIGNIKLRGPDKTLEAEAKRIIDKLPKMQPGKQRGTPVKVPFSLPINFKLQ